MKYFLIAGEHSGDQHASRLIKALQEKDQSAEFKFLGGDQMAVYAGEPVVHIREMAFMGFTRVLANLGQIRKNFSRAKRAIQEFSPDVIILVDYAGFNLRMAKWAKKKGFRSFYYIAPAVWAWNRRRVYSIRENCERVFCILPFEPEFYSEYDMEVDYVGNPVFEDVKKKKSGMPDFDDAQKKQIALLPGSRKQEIERLLPEMLSVISQFDKYSFVIAGVKGFEDLYNTLISENSQVRVEYDQALEILNKSVAALVTSGTATLETALMGVPQLILYKTNYISYQIARRLIKVPYISLVNLILKDPAIPELIQDKCNTGNIVFSLKNILPGGANRESQLELSGRIQEKLGNHNVANNSAVLIIKYIATGGSQAKIF